MSGLIEDLEAKYVLADAGYDSKANKQAILAINAVPVVACNPRRRGKQGKQPVYADLLWSKRYLAFPVYWSFKRKRFEKLLG